MNRERMRILLNGDDNRQLSMLIMHFYSLLTINNVHSSHLDVFKSIMNHPDQYARAYLPSMPHDDDYEAFQNFNSTKKEALKFYECPNGHVYSIGDCTKPNSVSVRLFCRL